MVTRGRSVETLRITNGTIATDPTHHIRFVYTPKHSFWLNKIEVVFGIINRRVMRDGSFKSKED